MITIKSPFDLMNFMFTSRDADVWNSITSHEKSAYQFIFNRTMGIGFPLLAMELNKVKTDALGVTETWHIIAKRFYGNRIPKFIYTKTEKKAKANDPFAGIPKWCIDLWCEKNECGEREFLQLKSINPESLRAELEYIKEAGENAKKYGDEA